MSFLSKSIRTLTSWLVLITTVGLAADAFAQNTGRVTGKVLDATGAPAAGVDVRLVELLRRATTSDAGEFVFEAVPPGRYVIQASNPRLGRRVVSLEVAAGGEARADLTLDVDIHHETVVVTGQPDARAGAEVVRPVAVLAGEDLRLRLEPTLGETVSQIAGVSSTYFGPGASRPIIRGIGGDRIRVLEDGIGTFDASSTSPDHAVSFDPIGIEQVEVVRGPATLLYGSSAVGGVVNTIDRRIPDSETDRTISGIVDLAGGTVSDERSGAAALQVGRGPVIVRGDFTRRETGDVDIPGFAESEALRSEEEEESEEHDEAQGTLENSAVESTSGSVGASLVGGRGFLGVSARGFDTTYGVPGHGHEEEGAEEAGVRIDLEQRRFDLRGGYTQPFAAFRAAKLRFGLADYRHVELEGDEIGTTFDNAGWEARGELLHKPLGKMSGSVGLQLTSRDFDVVGEEAFLPPTRTRTWALFAFEEIGTGTVRGQLGLRYENQDVESLGTEADQRSFNGFSGSAGVVWNAPSGFGASLSVARSVKLPNAEELFSNGPHVATRSFEVGDPDLDDERSLGIDLTVRKRSERFTGEVTFFRNTFDKYIFEELTGDQEDGLPVVAYTQKDARFMGAEIDAHLDLLETEPHHLDLELSGDIVRAELTGSGEDLPRIPPARYRVGLHYHSHAWNARLELRGTLKQDRIAPFERPTDGYALVNASLTYRIFAGQRVIDLILRGTNLADQEARVHSSFLKDLVPLPGRDVRLSARLTF